MDTQTEVRTEHLKNGIRAATYRATCWQVVTSKLACSCGGNIKNDREELVWNVSDWSVPVANCCEHCNELVVTQVFTDVACREGPYFKVFVVILVLHTTKPQFGS